MASIETTIDVDVPLRIAYNQWTQFEEFPAFMEGVKEVHQLDAQHLRWRAEVLGKEVEWDATILQQIPDERITWRSTSGAPNGGSISFKSLPENKTRLTLRVEYEPEGTAEKVASAIGLVSARVGSDLERFKKFIEERGRETGEWRGEIHGQTVTRPGHKRAG